MESSEEKMISNCQISNRGAKRIRQGHLWVYRSDVKDPGNATGGDLVQVIDETGNFVGQAFYSDASQIALRFLTTSDREINRDWWRARVRSSALRRQGLGMNTDAYRLIYSEGDLLSSIIVDCYKDVFVIQTLSQGADRVKGLLVELLAEEFQPSAIIERNDARVRHFEGLALSAGVLYGDPPHELAITQHGVRFIVSPLSGQKTGAFLDQRENYLAARREAQGRALDCFTFNGGFALHLSAVCENVLGLDISDEAIKAARQNADLNSAHNVDFRAANVFDALREFESQGEHFDTIVLDPPAFAKNRASVKAAVRGYKEINLRALKLLNQGGGLITCTCSYHMSEGMFQEIITEAALDARRRVQIIEKRGQSSDHPVLLGVPETHYLKCFLLRVIE